MWATQLLPFMDIASYPTLVVIDPEGRVTADNSENEFERILRGLSR